MKRLIEILNWPAKRGNGFVPWYVALWRILWLPLIFVGMTLACACILCAYGYDQARVTWRDVML